MMPYKWRDQIFVYFYEAANAWLEWWNIVKKGCPTMAENLILWINAKTREEWKNKALTNIDEYHCGRCGHFILERHTTIVEKLLEDIKGIKKSFDD